MNLDSGADEDLFLTLFMLLGERHLRKSFPRECLMRCCALRAYFGSSTGHRSVFLECSFWSRFDADFDRFSAVLICLALVGQNLADAVVDAALMR